MNGVGFGDSSRTSVPKIKLHPREPGSLGFLYIRGIPKATLWNWRHTHRTDWTKITKDPFQKLHLALLTHAFGFQFGVHRKLKQLFLFLCMLILIHSSCWENDFKEYPAGHARTPKLQLREIVKYRYLSISFYAYRKLYLSNIFWNFCTQKNKLFFIKTMHPRSNLFPSNYYHDVVHVYIHAWWKKKALFSILELHLVYVWNRW